MTISIPVKFVKLEYKKRNSLWLNINCIVSIERKDDDYFSINTLMGTTHNAKCPRLEEIFDRFEKEETK